MEVVTATVDLDEVVSYRGAVSSLQEQASSAPRVPTIAVDFNLCCSEESSVVPNGSIEPRYHVPEEEIALGQLLPLSSLLHQSGNHWHWLASLLPYVECIYIPVQSSIREASKGFVW